ncbi:radical SAM protein [bacterium]|jgi:MoaA/NifB/PqqE/SkfB family radical SAM enzyme|nr:radical SAM protein [bacterium]MBT3581926.1 radical SAM protein [bacterium]MBT4551721.1 radical SAM protein [bacterium]MBT5988146.1 radical SAM protein [bacterium]MBT7087399.1 radical SAM protein [bacterium]
MIKFFDFLSQNTLCVTKECILRCEHCHLWSNPVFQKIKVPKISDDGFDLFRSLSDQERNRKLTAVGDVSDLIQAGQFFKTFKKAKVFNVIGGEPLVCKELPYILGFLQKNKIKVRLWTNGVFNLDVLDQVKDLVDEFCFYLPSCDKKGYRLLTGFDGLGILEENIRYLQAEKRHVILNHFVTRSSLPDLPEVYEYARKFDLRLYLNYSVHAKFQRESIAYIKRFKKERKVMVLRKKNFGQDVCAGVHFDLWPRHDLETIWFQGQNCFQEFMRNLAWSLHV